jgi:DNA (cytosine-5)-methyltransferase 1
MILLDGFSGIGGFTKGLHDAGLTFSEHYFSEIDKHAIANYKYNFKDAKYAGSIEEINTKETPKPDLFTFGWPCQDNSIAGKRKGQKRRYQWAKGDATRLSYKRYKEIRNSHAFYLGERKGQTRSGLLHEANRIKRELQPHTFFAENVKGLLSVNDGTAIIEAIKILTEADTGCPQYTVEMQLFNTSWFLPQNRERLYFVGHLGTSGIKRLFPFGQTEAIHITTGTDKKEVHKPSSTLTARQYANWGGNFVKVGTWRTHKDNQGFRESKSDLCPTIPARARTDGSGQPVISVKAVLTPERKEKRQNGRRVKNDGEPSFTLNTQDRHGVIIQTNTQKGYDIANDGDSVNYSFPNSKTRRERIGKKKAQTIDTHVNQGVVQNSEIRRFTEVECERLQGFPDDWTKYGNYDGTIKKMSDAQRYKQLGNAVSTVVVKAITKELIKQVKSEPSKIATNF